LNQEDLKDLEGMRSNLSRFLTFEVFEVFAVRFFLEPHVERGAVNRAPSSLVGVL